MSSKETALWILGALVALVLLAGAVHQYHRRAGGQPAWKGCDNARCGCPVCQCGHCQCGGRR